MISIRDLEFSYNTDPILTGISLDITAGETIAVLGANGTGKTTLLKLIAGLLEPTRGTISGTGVVGFAPEDPHAAMFAETVADEVRFFPRNRGLDANQKADAAMRALDVYSLRDRNPYDLSVGEQRRVSIASVLAGDPGVIVLDEPTAGLDRRGERALSTVLRGIDRTIIFCTHVSDFAYEVADRTVLLSDGRILRDGTPIGVLTDDDILAAAGVQVPELVTWARVQGYEQYPGDFTEAVHQYREDRL